jgi:hypothetical protein
MDRLVLKAMELPKARVFNAFLAKKIPGGEPQFSTR